MTLLIKKIAAIAAMDGQERLILVGQAKNITAEVQHKSLGTSTTGLFQKQSMAISVYC
jgi:hypothetical protein